MVEEQRNPYMLPGMWGRADFEVRRVVAHVRDCRKPFICINSFNLYKIISLVCCYIPVLRMGKLRHRDVKSMCPSHVLNRWQSWDINSGSPTSRACPSNHTLCQFSKTEEKSQETCSLVSADMAQSPHLHSSLRSSPFTCSSGFSLNTSWTIPESVTQRLVVPETSLIL